MTISRLGHVGLVVTDVERYSEFLIQGLGLREVTRDGAHVYLGLNSRHHQVRLTHGTAYGCDGIGFDVADAGALAEMRSRVQAAGLTITAAQPVSSAVAAGFSFAVPDGPSIELCAGVAQTPPVEPDPLDVYRLRYRAPTRLRKLGHVAIGAPAPEQIERVFVEVLGFRISDRFPGVLSWARCNTDHHSVGFAPAVAPGAHHIAFEIESFAYYELLADHLARRGTRLVWGPGRHGPGNNLFVYLQDPEGGMIEIYSDLVQIEDDEQYTPTEWTEMQDVANSWGPLPDESWFAMLAPFTSSAPAAA